MSYRDYIDCSLYRRVTADEMTALQQELHIEAVMNVPFDFVLGVEDGDAARVPKYRIFANPRDTEHGTAFETTALSRNLEYLLIKLEDTSIWDDTLALFTP